MVLFSKCQCGDQTNNFSQVDVREAGSVGQLVRSKAPEELLEHKLQKRFVLALTAQLRDYGAVQLQTSQNAASTQP